MVPILEHKGPAGLGNDRSQQMMTPMARDGHCQTCFLRGLVSDGTLAWRGWELLVPPAWCSQSGLVTDVTLFRRNKSPKIHVPTKKLKNPVEDFLASMSQLGYFSNKRHLTRV